MMNDYWHIPRASLTSSSAASSSAASLASSSNRSTNLNLPTAKKTLATQYHERHSAEGATGRGNNQYNNNTQRAHHQQQQLDGQQQQCQKSKSTIVSRTTNTSTAGVGGNSGGNKRGSRSSQGSSDSNNSTRSAASGSLLLTAANLERFAEIHKKQNTIAQKQQQLNKFYLNEEQQQQQQTSLSSSIPSLPGVHNYNANLVQALVTARLNGTQISDIANMAQASRAISVSNTNNDTIIAMDPNLDFVKTKDLDSVSIASSMHFTMVNGESGSNKKQKRGLCDRGRQVTVLIISMSTVFLLLIMGMVYALEMRAREMPQS